MGTARPQKRARTSATPPTTPKSYPFYKPGPYTTTVRGQHAFKWLLSGLSVETFFSTHFEKSPIILHNPPSKFKSLISISDIEKLITSNKLHYGTDVDVTHYTPKAGRTTLNKATGTPAGAEAWRKVTHSKCSLRLLRPQQHSDALWHLCSLLESFLGCVVGANSYLTPPNSQGFAPHFDDIDAFVCQIHGQKRWRVYASRSDGLDVLPRASSVDFSKDEMKDVRVLHDVVLKPGDMLYLPRGAIHEAECVGGKGMEDASLHVTISAFQKWTWADLLLESFEVAIKSAAAEDKFLRRTLPLRFTDFVGVSKGEERTELREWFEKKVEGMVKRVAKKYPTDAAGDRLARRFMRERLPPVVGRGGGDVRVDSIVRLVGKDVARIVMDEEDGLPRLIHCVNNSRAAGGDEGEMSCLPEEALAVDVIIREYPEGVVVGSLPLEDGEDRVELARGLVDLGIVEVVE